MAPSIDELAVDVELARRAYRAALHVACDRQDGDDNRTCLYMRKHQEPTYPGGLGTEPVWPEIDLCARCALASARKGELQLYQARLNRWVRKLAAGKVSGPRPLVLAEGATKRKTWIASAGRPGALWLRLATLPDVPWSWCEIGLWSDGQAWAWRQPENESLAAKAVVFKTEPKRVLLASGFVWRIVRPRAELKESEI